MTVIMIVSLTNKFNVFFCSSTLALHIKCLKLLSYKETKNVILRDLFVF